MRKPIVLFFALSFILALVFFLFPINIFDGVIVHKDRLFEFHEERPLSLSYFIGLGYDKDDMETIKTFYLTTKGIVMAFLFILGFPAILAYRMHLKQAPKK